MSPLGENLVPNTTASAEEPGHSRDTSGGMPGARQRASDPGGEAKMAWHGKEVVGSIYKITDGVLAGEFVTQLAADLQDDSLSETAR